MRTRQSAETGNGAASGRKHGNRAARAASALAVSSPGDRLDYIADMVHELQALAAQADCKTLSGLLDLAYWEAVQKRRAG